MMKHWWMGRSKVFKKALLWSCIVFCCAWFVLLVKLYVVEAFEVPSSSMVPTLRVGDVVVVNKLAYGLPWSSKTDAANRPKRGDVVVFVHPITKEFYVKRVIAYPGEAVMVLGQRVFVNGEPLEQFDPQPDQHELPQWGQQWDQIAQIRWVSQQSKRYRVMWSKEDQTKIWHMSGYWVVPQDALFVMGDWRNESSDSRSWGAFSLNDLVGRVDCVIDGGKRTNTPPIPQRTRCAIDDPVQ